MIKVVNLVALIIAPIVVTYKEMGWVGWFIVLLLVLSLIWAIMRSKKPSADIEKAIASAD
ncbi:MAG: hypothetical protein KAI94_16115, partial [Anaerolineales bacterium]|nr:hypothetical protein [Anaerolineales bacterium]